MAIKRAHLLIVLLLSFEAKAVFDYSCALLSSKLEVTEALGFGKHVSTTIARDRQSRYKLFDGVRILVPELPGNPSPELVIELVSTKVLTENDTSLRYLGNDRRAETGKTGNMDITREINSQIDALEQSDAVVMASVGRKRSIVRGIGAKCIPTACRLAFYSSGFMTAALVGEGLKYLGVQNPLRAIGYWSATAAYFLGLYKYSSYIFNAFGKIDRFSASLEGLSKKDMDSLIEGVRSEIETRVAEGEITEGMVTPDSQVRLVIYVPEASFFSSKEAIANSLGL